MKTSICFIFAITIFSARAQEFATYEKDLIYDPVTMENLSRIVDSLNLKFKSCDIPHPYYGFPQGTITVFKVEERGKEERQAIRDGISPEEFHKRFPRVERKKDVRVMRYVAKDYDNKMAVHYIDFPVRDKARFHVQLANKPENVKTSGWIIDDTDRGFVAFYINSLEAKEIPKEYARLIQYVDCMVDPNAQIYFSKANDAVRNFVQIEGNKKAQQFIMFAHEFISAPAEPEFNYDSKLSDAEEKKQMEQWTKYVREYRNWDSLRILDLDRRMDHSQDKLVLLREACADALKSGVSNDEFEMYVSRYYSREKALELKRNRRVIGGCSMDLSPRTHAMNICVLAAQTATWDIFLRSHLDIMNDRFSRVSDGSYAWAGRQTYLRELEALEINASDLLIGTCLRTDNVADNHYFGDVSRIGRALSETSEPQKVERQLITMITDTNLDIFNRLLVGYVYSHYTHNLKDETLKEENKKKLLAAVASLPRELAEGFE
jgi:hypothetical protein